jgi:hypothetical protein
MQEFIGIKSTVKSKSGEIIRSGQTVKAYSRFSNFEEVEVEFRPDHGFKIHGNNLADVSILKVVKDISFWTKLKGNLKFLLFSLKNK